MNGNKIICIEGNIGVGKTTILNKLKELNINYIIPESVDIWQNYKDDNNKDIFTLYYNNPEKYAYLFQNFVLNSFIENFLEYNKKYKNSILIFERSFYSIRNVFIETLYLEKNLTKLEYKIFNKTFELITNLLNNYDIQIIYLQTDPLICMDRIINRKRTGEENITLKYLEKLHKFYEEWLLNNPKVIIIDGNKENLEINELNKIINLCNSFI
jgi:deoxyadenosine/deoxycytidine kinase